MVQHLRGDFAGQLRTLAEWARRAPASLGPDWRRLGALAALGRTEEVRSLASRLFDRMPNEAGPVVVAAHELAGHGRQSDALALARVGLARCEGAATPTPDQIRTALPLDCADLLGLLGRWHEANALIGTAGRVGLNRHEYLTLAGVAAAWLGNRTRALALSDSLARLPVRTVGDIYEIPLIEYRRAVIAAALGDREDALRRLTVWWAAGAYHPVVLHTEPALIPYFSDPRFHKFLESED